MAPRDLTVIHPPGAGAGESQIARPPSQGAASDQLVVGDIPRQAPDFQPRPGLLAELDRVGRGAQVLTGMRGVGTTQLAAAYARAKQAAGWRLVAWVNAENTGNLLAGLAAVADAEGLSHGGSGRFAADAGRVVRHWLETDGDRCLLVFDEAEDLDALQPFVPVGSARVLITTTRQPPANLGTSVSVAVFSADEAVAFLTGRTGLTDAEGAAAVAGELGHLPLALAQAAAVIAGQRLDYRGYLDCLRELPVQDYPTREDGQAYSHGVAEAVLLTLQAVRAADRGGVCTRVMEIMAVLSAAGVRRELLHVAGQGGLLASGGRRVAVAQVDRALEWLCDRSLLSFSLDGRTIIMHRLVALVVRDELARLQQLAAVCRAAAYLLETRAIALASPQDRPAVRDIPQQVTALLDNTAGVAGEADKELARILLRLRLIALYHLVELGDSTLQAIAVGESLTADLERLLGPDHPDTLTSRNRLAAAYRDAGRVAAAVPLVEQALADRESQPPADVAGQMPPVRLRRPPADPAVRLLVDSVARPSAQSAGHSSPSQAQGPPSMDGQYDREVVAAGGPAEGAVAYGRRVTGRAESTRFAKFSQAIRRVSWHGIRADPGAAIAIVAVVVWVVAAVSVTLLTLR